mmetsp:Transcript_11706/g.31546  ORF Transcript_11706/g.31546 Transcript_11706/m.31546 type:complete len:209 (-) Transcript_11706:1153-1779(-)
MTSCSKESSKTRQRPSSQPRGASFATLRLSPWAAVRGTRMPRWQVRRALVGPQWGRSCVPGVNTLKITSPPPHNARPTASAQCVCSIRIVSGKKLAYSSRSEELAKSGTSFQRPDFVRPPSCKAPGRPPTSEGPGVVSESSQSLRFASRSMYVSYSPRITSKPLWSARHKAKSSGSCQGRPGNVGTKCGGLCQMLYQMPLRAAWLARA